MSSTPRTSLIFDLDGTLIDSAQGVIASIEAALHSCGRPALIPLTAALVGPPLNAVLKRVAGTDSDATIAELAQSFRTHYDSIGYLHCPPYPMIDAMLAQLCETKVRVFLATNKREDPTRKILKERGWSDLFDDVVCVDSISPGFSDKASMLSRLITTHGMDVNSSAYVGDRIDDGLSADRAGIAFFAACWGEHTFPAQLPDRWTRIDSPIDLV